MKNSGKQNVTFLLVENDKKSAELRADSIRNSAPNKCNYDVAVVSSESDAQECILRKRFDFLLIDLLLKRGSSSSTVDHLLDIHIDDEQNGAKTLRRLLNLHRKTHNEKPWHPIQCRPILYSAAQALRPDYDRIRTKVLSLGAYEFISSSPDEMNDVLAVLSDMRELQAQMYLILTHKSWISQVINNLGCGISIIGRNWKIWYCSPQNARFSGLRMGDFVDDVCWLAYHHFHGRSSPCPECPAAIVMGSVSCPYPEKRKFKCFIEGYPFTGTERPCSHPANVGKQCEARGKRLHSYSNCRLLLLKDKKVEWVKVIASPILSADRRVIGAVETVLDIHDTIEGYWDSKQITGVVSAEERLRPVMELVRWLGYPRARVLTISSDKEEVVGIAQTGDCMRIKNFIGYRFPSSQTSIPEREAIDMTSGIVRDGPGYLAEEFGKEGCVKYLEFVLHDPTAKSDSLVGTLVVDAVKVAGEVCGANYSDQDISRLLPVAVYIAKILGLRRQHLREKALSRHAEGLRELEAVVEHYPHKEGAEAQVDEKFKRVLAGSLRKVLNREPNLTGYHLRLRMDNGKLQLFRGVGKYVHRPRLATNAESLSNKCLQENKEYLNIKAKECKPFQQLLADAKQNGNRSLIAWCEAIQVLGCLPIMFGKTRVGTLAVQSQAVDFFMPETVAFLRGVCSFIGRSLGPSILMRSRHIFYENLAYAFHGPASGLADIAKLRIRSAVGESLNDAKEEYALAVYLSTRAKAFCLDTRRDDQNEHKLEKVLFATLWEEWCQLFGGLQLASRKTFNISMTNNVSGETCISTVEQLLTEMMFHIVENGTKACCNRVRIQAIQDGEFVVVIVDDDGNGFPESVFNNPWRGEHVRYERNASQGLGLGLKVSKRHGERLGIDIVIRRHGDLKGARVSLRIPVAN